MTHLCPLTVKLQRRSRPAELVISDLVFGAVAPPGTVTKAAEELRVPASAVSQQLKVLETQLGAQLFRREKRRLIPTPDGDRLCQTTSRSFGAPISRRQPRPSGGNLNS